MKGTLFSADFVTDKDNDLRLIEINTDTGIVASQKDVFDWSDFITLLDSSTITQIDVVYKWDIQKDIVQSLSASLHESASFITTFNEIVVPAESIFPTSPTDDDSKFILRMAYDEAAILDSEYAKGTLNLLKLFADNNDTGSVTNFYHSSSYYGEYNSLDTDIFNGANLPDAVVKTVVEEHTPHKFYKIGHSDSGSTERYTDFINTIVNSDDIIQQYHIPQSQIDRGVVSSIRSFQIVYGGNLDICHIGQYEIDSVLDLPTGSITFDDTKIDNLIDSKHYYEYATNSIKNKNHGLLESERILDVDGNSVEVKDLVIGNAYKSFHIEGAPNTDDYEVLRQWEIDGDEIPSGSFSTSSVLVGKYEDVTYANDITEIVFENGADVYVGGEARLLVYDQTADKVRYVRVADLTTDYQVFGDGDVKVGIDHVNLVIFDEQQPIYMMNMEDVDNFILEDGNFVSFFIVHNLIGGSCFPAGTKVISADGTEKNIEDIVEGDAVLSYNETTLKIEPKNVIGLKQPIHNDLVTYHFSDQSTLTCTFDHPIYVNGLELASFRPELTNSRYEIGREIHEIKIGDIVKVGTNGRHTAIMKIEVLPPVDVQTYIITVEDNHNFFANNILVHNK
jgi:hypothetical protein